MIKIYFDKNVLSHIISSRRGATETNGVNVDDFNALRTAVGAGKIVNLLSDAHLQEAAYALRASTPDAAHDELQLIRELMDTTRIIKDPKALLTDDVVGYARGEGPSSPLIQNPYDLEWILKPGGEDIAGHKQALNETDKQNAEFLARGEAADANDRQIILDEFGGQPTFEELYERKIRQRLVELIGRVEKEIGASGLLAACEERGIEGMLNVRSIALAEGINLSYQYASVFGELKQNRKFRRGDPPDLKHALQASAADVFVTHDQALSAWVGRIPHSGFEVLDHVHQLVERVG